MHRTRIPLTTWVGGALWVLRRGPTASPGSLRKEFGIGSNNTARSLLQALESWMLPDSDSQLSGVVQVKSVEISGRDRGCTAHSTIDQVEEILVASEVLGDGTRGDLRVGRIPAGATAEATWVSRWEFVHRVIAPGAEARFGEGFGAREEALVVDPAGFLDPEVRDAYDRWGGTARLAARGLSGFRDRIRNELPVEAGCVSRSQLAHYITKAEFRWRHEGEDSRELVRHLFSRALGVGRRKESAATQIDDGPSDPPADLEADNAKAEDSNPQFDLFGGSS